MLRNRHMQKSAATTIAQGLGVEALLEVEKDPRTASISVSTERAYDSFILASRAARLAPKTLLYYECQLTPFVHWCASESFRQVASISPSLIRSYLVKLQERGLTDSSVHAAARAIRAFLNFCVREEFIAISPMQRVAMPRMERRILPSFTDKQIHSLLRASESSREKALVLFLLDTGCRAAEAVDLNGGDIDVQGGEAQIRKGKGRKGRTVFFGQRARAALSAYYAERGTPEPQQPVWVSDSRGARLTPSGLHQLLKRLGARAGVSHCAPHTFRRTFAISSLRNGMDIFRLARLMGHADISVLRQYLYLLKDDLRTAHAQFGVVDRLVGD